MACSGGGVQRRRPVNYEMVAAVVPDVGDGTFRKSDEAKNALYERVSRPRRAEVTLDGPARCVVEARWPRGERQEMVLRALYLVERRSRQTLADALASLPSRNWPWSSSERADATSFVQEGPRKDLRGVARRLGRSLGEVIEWYYSSHKPSREYAETKDARRAAAARHALSSSKVAALASYLVSCGAPRQNLDGWTASARIRSSGTSKGTVNVYYHAPSGKTYRSRADVARAFGLDPAASPRRDDKPLVVATPDNDHELAERFAEKRCATCGVDYWSTARQCRSCDAAFLRPAEPRKRLYDDQSNERRRRRRLDERPIVQPRVAAAS
ncbi:hypothetical protein CTAYLR_008058 [Chrysophaeum taylorii]|uniref:MBD domain-containing protein n=1 Tax=Chrysophaeum taylorii TaxID=2483200 RepID=A0AAD7XPP8_9STRA|nr:hypothetical protein CTAYLR_008058 [Chrysophaeum taylorii]